MYVDLNSLFLLWDFLLDESLNAELILDLITNKSDADFAEMSIYPEAYSQVNYWNINRFE